MKTNNMLDHGSNWPDAHSVPSVEYNLGDASLPLVGLSCAETSSLVRLRKGSLEFLAPRGADRDRPRVSSALPRFFSTCVSSCAASLSRL